MARLMMATDVDDKVDYEFKIGDITSSKLESTYTFFKMADIQDLHHLRQLFIA